MLYELIYLLPPHHTAEEATVQRGQVLELIKKIGATDIQEEDMGKRKLAYKIRQATHAFYTQVRFRAEKSGAKQLQEALRLDTDVLRFELTHGLILSLKEKLARTSFARPSAVRPVDVPAEANIQPSAYNVQPMVEQQPINASAPTPTPAPQPQVALEDLDKKLAELLEDTKI